MQLHLHPHWLDSTFHDGRWVMDVRRYRLDQWPPDEREAMLRQGAHLVERLAARRPIAFRAGGWCIQPVSAVRDVLLDLGLTMESSVFPGGFRHASHMRFDFRKCPSDQPYRFDDDVCTRDPDGAFVEYPLAAAWYSPLFFWRLFALGRLRPRQHKPLGDGVPVGGRNEKWGFLTAGRLVPLSTDGFFSSDLERRLRAARRRGRKVVVTIGHPKACTNYSLSRLERMIGRVSPWCDFALFRDL